MKENITLQVGVKVLLKNKEGKYLLLRRNPKKYPEIGAKWDIVGGRIEPGTTLLENLRREIKEEVGLEYVSQPKLVAAQDILVHKNNQSGKSPLPNPPHQGEGKHVVRLTYTGEINGKPKINSDHLEAKWFTAEEIETARKDTLDSYFKELIDSGAVKL